MTRGIDLSGMSPAERYVASAGTMLFVNGFVPWWYRIRTPGGTYLHNAGLTGWGLIAVLAGFAAAVFAVGHAVRRSTRFRTDFAVYIGLGIVAVGALIAQSRHQAQWIGYWVALVAAALVIAGGIRRGTERRRGWV